MESPQQKLIALEKKNVKTMLLNRKFTENEIKFKSFSLEENNNMVDNKKLQIHWLYLCLCKKPISAEMGYVNTLVIRISNERVRYVNKLITNKIFKYIAKNTSTIYKLNELEQSFNSINSNIILITEKQFINKKTILFKYHFPDSSNSNTYVRLFPAEHIRFNILEHSLVPKIQVLSKEEIQTLCDYYKSPKFINKLPIMNIHDPISRYLGGRDGTVYKITYKSDNTISYRVVRNIFQ